MEIRKLVKNKLNEFAGVVMDASQSIGNISIVCYSDGSVKIEDNFNPEHGGKTMLNLNNNEDNTCYGLKPAYGLRKLQNGLDQIYDGFFNDEKTPDWNYICENPEELEKWVTG